MFYVLEGELKPSLSFYITYCAPPDPYSWIKEAYF